MPFGLPDDAQRLSYGGYLRVPELLALQRPLSDPPHHDELLFIIVHQVYELWFKELLHELDAIVRLLARDDVLEAVRLLRRCIEIARVLVAQVAVLETMTPADFLAFRDRLAPASGFQSWQFRELELAAGLRDASLLDLFPPGSAERAALEQRWARPTLREAWLDALRRRGPAAETVEAQLVRVYTETDAAYPWILLAEALVEFDETFQLWRLRHVQMVERIIGGGRPGTGGSSGAAYLRSTLDRRTQPELWSVRDALATPRHAVP